MQNRKYNLKQPLTTVAIASLLFVTGSGQATTWYVDNTATGSNNGTSWANAWTRLTAITGVQPGDTVYISGGPSGSSRSYNVSGSWSPINGSSSAVITYQIGQDSLHNGTAIFNTTSGDDWMGGESGRLENIVISGDAGDGRMHFQMGNLGGGGIAVGTPATNVRWSYINGGQQPGGAFYFNTCQQIEIDHCYWYEVYYGGNGPIIFMITNSGRPFNDTVIHDNTFYAPRSATVDGWGNDVANGSLWSGVSFYNNDCISYSTTSITSSSVTDHQDGIQVLAGDHMLTYNNYFQDFSNYPIYGDGIDGGFTDWYIYNNIIVLTDPVVEGFVSPQGIAIGSEGTVQVFRNVVIANNMCVDYGTHLSMSLRTGASFPGCVAGNNICLNSDGGFIWDPSVSAADNLTIDMTNGDNVFESYTPSTPMPPNNFQLLSGAMQEIGRGVNLSQYFTVDKGGNPRPSSGAWDIGPYEFAGNAVLPPPPRDLRIVPTSNP